MSEQVFEGWCILELMGHRKLTGFVSQQEIAGAGFLRIDVPSEPPVTQFYAPAAVYAITPTTEAMARQYAAGLNVVPVSRWELPAQIQPQDPDDNGPGDGEERDETL